MVVNTLPKQFSIPYGYYNYVEIMAFTINSLFSRFPMKLQCNLTEFRNVFKKEITRRVNYIHGDTTKMILMMEKTTKLLLRPGENYRSSWIVLRNTFQKGLTVYTLDES